MELATRLITESDDLDSIVADINDAQWDVANEMAAYQVQSMCYYLQ
jgi:hypothetical protein